MSHVLKDGDVSHIATVLEEEYPKWKEEHERCHRMDRPLDMGSLIKDNELERASYDPDASVTLRVRNTLKLKNVKNMCNFDPQTQKWEVRGDHSERGRPFVRTLR